MPAGQVLPVPPGVSLKDAASLPEVACTVWSTVFMTSHLSAGESFLVSRFLLRCVFARDRMVWWYESASVVLIVVVGARFRSLFVACFNKALDCKTSRINLICLLMLMISLEMIPELSHLVQLEIAGDGDSMKFLK